MRIWHEKLIPHLCQKHLCAMWREGLGAYKIITENKKGYSNHPAVKEFEFSQGDLWDRLSLVREHMLLRGYNPKPMPDMITNGKGYRKPIPWQSLQQQIEVIKLKGCKCQINNMSTKKNFEDNVIDVDEPVALPKTKDTAKTENRKIINNIRKVRLILMEALKGYVYTNTITKEAFLTKVGEANQLLETINS